MPTGKHKMSAAAILGKKGGEARAANMTPSERTKAARKAATARWKKRLRRK
jgi:hypothetical protein